MTRDEFWELIDRLIAETDGDLDYLLDALDVHLEAQAADTIADFARHYTDLQNEANTPAILDAATIIGCGDSADGYGDFRRWLVFQGRDNFATFLAAPDGLGSYDPDGDPIEDWYCEYDPGWAFEAVSDDALPDFEVTPFLKSAGARDEASLARRYPDLWHRCR